MSNTQQWDPDRPLLVVNVEVFSLQHEVQLSLTNGTYGTPVVAIHSQSQQMMVTLHSFSINVTYFRL